MPPHRKTSAKPRADALRATIAALAALAMMWIGAAGCQIVYLTRAAWEEGRLLCNRRPIAQELGRPNLAPEARDKLQTVLKVRRFADEQLGLNVGDAYHTITTVDEGAVVWVVMAAPKDSLKPYTWWFPIVGSVPYRGFFDRADAVAAAGQFERYGFDTLVRPAVAFSSLGFFNDPLLSNLLKLDRVQLAGVIIHELFHRTFFLPGDVMFDESAATYAGARGAVEFFASTEGPDSADSARAREIVRSDLLFADFLQREEARLLGLYGRKLPTDEIVKRREPILRQIQADYVGLKPSLSGL
jgi:predicted aminopeptidase